MENKLPFGKTNFQLMLIGIVALATGFVLMSIDKEPYGFGFFGLILGPVIVIAGFIIEIFAILYTPKEKK
jgi:Protein of unknown function (DUF3098)